MEFLRRGARTLTLTDAERKIIGDLLELAAGEFDNHGCNDYFLDHTDENYKILQAVGEWEAEGYGEYTVETFEGRWMTMDISLMRYFAHKLRTKERGESDDGTSI